MIAELDAEQPFSYNQEYINSIIYSCYNAP